MNPELVPYLDRIHRADARELPLPSHSIGVACFSPPYFGLRQYGTDPAEIGRESLADYLKNLVRVFDELERVLEPDGLAWCNIGDTRTGSGGAGGDYSSGNKAGRPKYRQGPTGLHRGQWALVPHRLAIELQAVGWLVIADVTWSKGNVRLRNGVPELVTRRRPEDLRFVKRPGISSERIFLFARTTKARHRFRPSMLEEPGDVWTFAPNGDKRRPKHEAPYPPELVRRCILPTTLPGDVILDPFAGRGTTLHVAADHGRHAIGFDLYVDAVVKETESPSTPHTPTEESSP